jgi:hypothetical protein
MVGTAWKYKFPIGFLSLESFKLIIIFSPKQRNDWMLNKEGESGDWQIKTFKSLG